MLHKNVNSDHYALIGGRVEIGESSVIQLKDKLKKETNLTSNSRNNTKPLQISRGFKMQNLSTFDDEKCLQLCHKNDIHNIDFIMLILSIKLNLIISNKNK